MSIRCGYRGVAGWCAMGRRRFGKLRKLPSGRYQASFVGPSGQRQTAPNTFRTKTDADRWLVNVESDISRGVAG